MRLVSHMYIRNLLTVAPLARIWRQPSAAAAESLAVAGRTPSSRFDIVSTMPSASFSPFAPPQRRFSDLATNAGAICGLAWMLAAAVVYPSSAEPLHISEDRQRADSAETHREILASNSAYPDQRVQDYVNRIGQELARNSDRPDIQYTFTVIDSGNINAFAMPGGYVYVNRGLMLYLDSEAELAGVIGHEIGHITARHAARQKNAAANSKLFAQAAYVLTGSADLAEASSMAGTVLVRGYGRDHELEADRKGAAYLHRSGYDPDELLNVISVLKDQQLYQRRRAQKEGGKTQTYHGLFSTHPRNDARLLQMIRTAKELPPVSPKVVNPAEFRSIINGMTFGKRARVSQRDEQRFYHNKLQFSFVKPEGWSVQTSSSAIVSKSGDGSAELTLTIKRWHDKATLRGFLGEQLQADRMTDSKHLQQEGLTGYTAIAPASPDMTPAFVARAPKHRCGGADGWKDAEGIADTMSKRLEGVRPATASDSAAAAECWRHMRASGRRQGSRRLALITRGRIAYLFEGKAVNEAEFPIKDAYFNAMIGSFRPMKKAEAPSRGALQIEYIQATADMSWPQLAKQIKVPDAENQLRLLNAQYPRGEPGPGGWIKVLRNPEI